MRMQDVFSCGGLLLRYMCVAAYLLFFALLCTSRTSYALIHFMLSVCIAAVAGGVGLGILGTL